MKYSARIIIAIMVLLALSCGPAMAGGAEPSVRVSVDRRAILIGNKILYKIQVSCPKGLQVELPKFKDDIAGDFEIKDAGSKTEKAFFGGTKYTNWYAITTYTPGKYKTPIAAVRFKRPKDEDWKAKGLSQIDITVDSVLPKGVEPRDIKDIKGPIEPFSINYWLIGSLLLAVALLWAAITAYIRHKNRVVPKSPYEIAIAELDEAKALLDTSSDIKGYYIKVSDCIRRYIEKIFKLRAPEMTTQEFLRSLQGAGRLPAEYKVLLKEFMEACDLVKFAKYVPARKEAEAVLAAARNFIDGTRVFPEEKKDKK